MKKNMMLLIAVAVVIVLIVIVAVFLWAPQLFGSAPTGGGLSEADLPPLPPAPGAPS
jgi:hypothetical protein